MDVPAGLKAYQSVLTYTISVQQDQTQPLSSIYHSGGANSSSMTAVLICDDAAKEHSLQSWQELTSWQVGRDRSPWLGARRKAGQSLAASQNAHPALLQ